MQVVVDRHTFTVDEYHRMAESGILTQDDRVELINGEIISMSPINSSHASVVDRFNTIFNNRLSGQVIVRIQSTLQIPEHSEPEPDVMLLKYRDDFYADAHPQSDDVYLLVEVADSSLPVDRKIKLPLYAQAQVAEVWIVNLTDQQIEGYRLPSEDHYQESWVASHEQDITIPHFTITVAVKDLIG